MLDAQREHWERTLGEKAEMFGRAPSEPAYKAAEIFEREGSRKILELGAGQGREARDPISEQEEDYGDEAIESGRANRWRSGLVFVGFLLIAGFFLWEEHKAHLFGTLPYLLLLLCPILHLFHGGHGGHGGGNDQNEQHH